MPIYEYRCRGCQRDFERYVASPGATTAACPDCSSGDVMRKLTVFGMKSEGGSMASEMSGMSGGGGCCGGGCSCH